jgi:endonuclease III
MSWRAPPPASFSRSVDLPEFASGPFECYFSGAMPRESRAARQERSSRIIGALRRTYPEAHCELNYSNPLELLIATILSAQCTDKQVNIVTQDLFKKYRTAADYANADLPELENDIRRLGFFRNKAKNIKACCRQLVDKYGGKVPQTMEELVALEGVGRKTANVVLGNAFNINEGVVVDTHVARLSQRLGLTKESTPEKIEAEMMNLVPREDWAMFSHWLICHGRRRCSARKPACPDCELRDLCPSRDLEK